MSGVGGVLYKFSSAKGEATVTCEREGWTIRGVQTLGRTDARPIAEPKADGEYDWAAGMPSADYLESDHRLGPFAAEGLEDYKAARPDAYHRLALIPARVPFSALDDGTAEASRDNLFLREQIKAFQMKKPGTRVTDSETFYENLVEAEAERKEQRARNRRQRESLDR